MHQHGTGRQQKKLRRREACVGKEDGTEVALPLHVAAAGARGREVTWKFVSVEVEAPSSGVRGGVTVGDR